MEEAGAAKATKDRPRDVLPLRNAVNMDCEEDLIKGLMSDWVEADVTEVDAMEV